MPDPGTGTAGHDAQNPLQIPLRGWKSIVVRTAKAMGGMDTTLRCAGVAFFSFLSIFPAIGIAVFMLGLLANEQFLADQFDRFAPFMPGVALDLLEERLEILIDQPTGNLSIGLIVAIVIALWSGSRGMNALMFAATAAYYEKSERPFLVSVFLSFAVTLAGAAFLLIALALVAAVPALANLSPIPGTADRLALIVRWPLLLLIAMVGITLLYYTIERRPPKPRWIWPGALLASVLWLGASMLFSLYVENLAQFEATFGSLTAAVVLMFWLYISALIFVLGATLNAEIELQTRKDSTIGKPKPMGKRGAYVADERPHDE